MKKTLHRVIDLWKLAFKDSAGILFASLIIFFLIRFLTPVTQAVTMTWIFDSLEKGDLREVYLSLAGVIGITVLNAVLLYLLQVYLDPWADLIREKSNMKLIGQLVPLPQGSLKARYENGELVNRVGECSRMSFSLSLSPCSLLAKIITCICFSFLLSRMSWESWLVILAVFCIIVFLTKLQLKTETKLNKEMQEAYGRKEVVTRELVTKIEFYDMNSLNEYIWKEYQGQRDEMFKVGFRQALYAGLYQAVHDMTALLGKAGLLLFGGAMRAAGLVTAGVISALPTIYDNLIRQMEGVRTVIIGLPGQTVPINRYYDVTESVSRKASAEGSCRPIQLADVKVRINGKTILNNIDLTINTGEKVAIIGSNGSGKTTLLKTMLGMYEGDFEGEMRYLPDSLADISAYIPSSHQLFNGTALENVRSSCRKKDCIDIENHFLYPAFREIGSKMKDELSDGQKQIVSILRGYCKKADFLFGDEVTSFIDPVKQESVIQNIIKDFNTVILITHDPGSLKFFDRIIMMKEGGIVADDSYENLKETEEYQDWLRGDRL
ncbi:MAG: ABC transporter ATP-binding protein/permease [Acetatifactor sp.]|nr:ABC transporter ATP-binding protein/permease [Acetatifactor sp.]